MYINSYLKKKICISSSIVALGESHTAQKTLRGQNVDFLKATADGMYNNN